jgi:N-ethylmaleimide reductase
VIICEATQISPAGQGYLDTPGIYDTFQIAAWRKITDAVHSEGSRIIAQLWHVGRISHVSLQPDGRSPVSSTGRQANAKAFTAKGFEEVSHPRALRIDELPGIVAEYRQAAANAIEAGFDGVEVHGANGYLIEQFLRDSINDRSDRYGGSIENRVRLPVEIMRAIVTEIGAGRTGMRISPVSPVNDAQQDSDPQRLFDFFVDQLGPLRLAFIHIIEGVTGGTRDNAIFDYIALRNRFKQYNSRGAWIVNNGYTRAMAMATVVNGTADMVAFGKPFISNPDLVERLRINAPLATLSADGLYGGGAAGYTDYPTMDAAFIASLLGDRTPPTKNDLRRRA